VNLRSYELCCGFVRYGKHCTLGTANNKFWRAIIPCSLLYAVGHCFDRNVFGVTSNAGQVVLLLGTTITVGLVQRDLVIAGSFAAFLHKSNEAFTAAVPERRHSSGNAGGKAPAPSMAGSESNGGIELTAAHRDASQTSTENANKQVAVTAKAESASAV
jgi:hypothetical protein